MSCMAHPCPSLMCIYFALCSAFFLSFCEDYTNWIFPLLGNLNSLFHVSELYLFWVCYLFFFLLLLLLVNLRDHSSLPIIEERFRSSELKTVMLIYKIIHLWNFIHHVFALQSADLGVYFGCFNILHFLPFFILMHRILLLEY